VTYYAIVGAFRPELAMALMRISDVGADAMMGETFARWLGMSNRCVEAIGRISFVEDNVG
jgi:hypothetical protein